MPSPTYISRSIYGNNNGVLIMSAHKVGLKDIKINFLESIPCQDSHQPLVMDRHGLQPNGRLLCLTNTSLHLRLRLACGIKICSSVLFFFYDFVVGAVPLATLHTNKYFPCGPLTVLYPLWGDHIIFWLFSVSMNLQVQRPPPVPSSLPHNWTRILYPPDIAFGREVKMTGFISSLHASFVRIFGSTWTM